MRSCLTPSALCVLSPGPPSRVAAKILHGTAGICLQGWRGSCCSLSIFLASLKASLPAMLIYRGMVSGRESRTGVWRAPLPPRPLRHPSPRCCACIGSLETQGKSRVSGFAQHRRSVAEPRVGFAFPSPHTVPLRFEAASEMQRGAGWKSRVCSALLSSLGSSLPWGIDMPGSCLCQPLGFFVFFLPSMV